MIAPSYDPPIIVAATSTYIGGVMTSCVAPTTVGAMSAVGSPVRPIVGSGVATIVGCSVIFEGTPFAPMSARPAESTGTTIGGA